MLYAVKNFLVLDIRHQSCNPITANIHLSAPIYLAIANMTTQLKPVSFDHALEHRHSTSASALFNLPVEILGLILEFVESSSLATLALVNSDCRQLARSRQFVDVRLDYSHASEALVRMLLSETNERRMNNGSTLLPSLGACIRRLTVSIDTDAIRQRLYSQNAHDSNIHGLTLIEAEDPRWKSIFTTINKFYLPLVQAIIRFNKTMPRLEILDWEEPSHLSEDFYNALPRSSVQHLKLCHPVNKVFEISLSQRQFWPLRTLHLELTCDIWGKETTATLCASILRLCAPSLETLVWINRRRKDRQTFRDGPLPQFPCLRNLDLQMLELADSSIMDAFLRSKLVNVNLRLEKHIVDKTLGSCGRISSLKAVSSTQPPLSFLRANTQLSKIDFDCAVFSSEALEVQVLPVLSTFSNLTSLRISWPKSCSVLPETGLRLIGSLHTINQLCISCGRLRDWQRSWKVDHVAIRRHLSPLRYLQRLALSGDTYNLNANSPISERYYEDTFATELDLGYTGVPLDDVPSDIRRLMIDPKLGKPYWEKRHRERMIAEGNEYVNVFARLEWIYFGQRAMCVQGDDGWRQSRRIVSIVEMVGKTAYLNKVFGILPENYKPFRAVIVATHDERDDIGS